MSPDEKQQLKKTWILMCAYYQAQIPDGALLMYVEDVEDLNFADVTRAMHAYRKNPKNRTPPLPAHIRDQIAPQIDDDTEARDAGARIIQAISKFGYTNPGPARGFMGELAWSVVNRQGGWTNLCESFLVANTGIWQAQFRDLAKAQLSLARAGRLDTPPSLPESRHSQLEPSHTDRTRQLASMIKDLAQDKGC